MLCWRSKVGSPVVVSYIIFTSVCVNTVIKYLFPEKIKNLFLSMCSVRDAIFEGNFIQIGAKLSFLQLFSNFGKFKFHNYKVSLWKANSFCIHYVVKNIWDEFTKAWLSHTTPFDFSVLSAFNFLLKGTVFQDLLILFFVFFHHTTSPSPVSNWLPGVFITGKLRLPGVFTTRKSP